MVEHRLHPGQHALLDARARLSQRRLDGGRADHLPHDALGDRLDRLVGVPRVEQVFAGVADLPEHGEIDVDDVLVAGQHQALRRHGLVHRVGAVSDEAAGGHAQRLRPRRGAVAHRHAVDAGDGGGSAPSRSAKEYGSSGRQRGADEGAEAQHHALLVRLDPVEPVASQTTMANSASRTTARPPDWGMPGRRPPGSRPRSHACARAIIWSRSGIWPPGPPPPPHGPRLPPPGGRPPGGSHGPGVGSLPPLFQGMVRRCSCQPRVLPRGRDGAPALSYTQPAGLTNCVRPKPLPAQHRLVIIGTRAPLGHIPHAGRTAWLA